MAHFHNKLDDVCTQHEGYCSVNDYESEVQACKFNLMPGMMSTEFANYPDYPVRKQTNDINANRQ